MDNSYCCVPQCNSIGSHHPRTSFHRFPRVKDESSRRRRQQWIFTLRIGREVSNRMVVCGKHFKPSDFLSRASGKGSRTTLKLNAIPSLNLPLSSCENRDRLYKKKEDSSMRKRKKEKRERFYPIHSGDPVDAGHLSQTGALSSSPGEKTHTLTGQEYEEIIQKLKTENLDLKFKLFMHEEKLIKKCYEDGSAPDEDPVEVITKLNSETESLQKKLQYKDKLLQDALELTKKYEKILEENKAKFRVICDIASEKSKCFMIRGSQPENGDNCSNK